MYPGSTSLHPHRGRKSSFQPQAHRGGVHRRHRCHTRPSGKAAQPLGSTRPAVLGLGPPVWPGNTLPPCPQTTCSPRTLPTPTTCTHSRPSWTASPWRTSLRPSQTKPCPTEGACRAGVRGPQAGRRCRSSGGAAPMSRSQPGPSRPAEAHSPPRGNGCSHRADCSEHRPPGSREVKRDQSAPRVPRLRGQTQELPFGCNSASTPHPQKQKPLR